MTAICFHIIAHRSPLSVAGPGRAPLKGRDGRPLPFATYEDALAEAKRLNRETRSPHVHYTADPYPYVLHAADEDDDGPSPTTMMRDVRAAARNRDGV